MEITFTADNCSYFPGRPSKLGFLGPFIGAAENEALAYLDAVNAAFAEKYPAINETAGGLCFPPQ